MKDVKMVFARTPIDTNVEGDYSQISFDAYYWDEEIEGYTLCDGVCCTQAFLTRHCESDREILNGFIANLTSIINFLDTNEEEEGLTDLSQYRSGSMDTITPSMAYDYSRKVRGDCYTNLEPLAVVELVELNTRRLYEHFKVLGYLGLVSKTIYTKYNSHKTNAVFESKEDLHNCLVEIKYQIECADYRRKYTTSPKSSYVCKGEGYTVNLEFKG